MQFEQKSQHKLFNYILGIGCFALAIAIGVYSYLGSFSRYISDDYCEAVRVNSSSPLNAVMERYTSENWPRPTVRYSNLFFVGVSELFGPESMPGTISIMPVLWSVGLVWSVYELRKLLRIDWSFLVDLFFGLSLAFFSFLQAPDLFQTIFWRSAMMTHFAPLVFGSFLFAALLRSLQQVKYNPVKIWVYLLLFIGSFIFAGFSEPPTTTALTVLPIFMLMVWVLGKPETKRGQMYLLAITLLGTLIGLMTMLLSPAGSNATRASDAVLSKVLADSFFYSYLFMLDSLNTLPLSIFISVLSAFLLICLNVQTNLLTRFSALSKQKTLLVILLLPLFAWFFIAAGFAPSVYGQGYPVERARFLARVIMISTFMLDGALIGILFHKVNSNTKNNIFQWTAATLFILTGLIYPFRAAVNVYQKSATEFQSRAEMWDLRNEYIIRHAKMGEQDIKIPGYSGVYKIKELDGNPEHWVNRCAAGFYGINSIQTFNMSNEDALEYLNE